MSLMHVLWIFFCINVRQIWKFNTLRLKKAQCRKLSLYSLFDHLFSWQYKSTVIFHHYNCYCILVLRTANLTQTGPNSAETLSKVRRRYCMSVNAILSTGQGQGQVTIGHYIQKSHCGHVIHVLWPILAI